MCDDISVVDCYSIFRSCSLPLSRSVVFIYLLNLARSFFSYIHTNQQGNHEYFENVTCVFYVEEENRYK